MEEDPSPDARPSDWRARDPWEQSPSDPRRPAWRLLAGAALLLAGFALCVLLPRSSAFQCARGWVLTVLDRPEMALAAYDTAARLDPQDPRAHRGRGWSLYVLERFPEALAALDEAIRLDPERASAHEGRGSTLWCLERWEAALGAYEQALALRPRDPAPSARPTR